jgi:uncharacterized oxidoreductase
MPLQTPQTILVTGANQGIGRELALQLAAQGHTLIAWARNAELLASIASEHIHVAVVDLADTAALPSQVAAMLATYPDLSGVIHNAAIQIERVLSDTNAEQVQQEIAINLTAPIVLTQLLLPHLKRQKHAFICNISSVLALAAKRNSAVYCATKAGLHVFSDSLRAQLAGSGVQVTEVMPPTVETRMTAGRDVPKMQAAEVARLTIAAVRAGKRSVLLGKGKWLGVLLVLMPPLAKKIMLQF